MKMPDRNSSGRIEPFTMAGDASALGMAAVIARPSAQKLADPTTSTTRDRSSVPPDGSAAL